ncbi:MAG: hypothetical protein AAGA70_09525 [Pseudomonadota bacterium]
MKLTHSPFTWPFMAMYAEHTSRLHFFGRFSGALVATAIVALGWLTLSVASLWHGALLINIHSGDVLHLLDILGRWSLGQRPHQDFMTPIGALAFLPIWALTSAGMSVGMALICAQVILGAVIGSAALFIALRRVDWPYATGLALIAMVLTMALVDSDLTLAISMSLHYNRWAWALGLTAVFAACLPARNGEFADGLILGTIAISLLLIKATYFAAFAPVVLLALCLTQQVRTLVTALVTALGLAGLTTAAWGIGFWQAYLQDLLTVAFSESRSAPGSSLQAILIAPNYVAATGLALAAVILLRLNGLKTQGLLVLLIIPAGAYVTYQNFGNDPLYIALLALLLAVWLRDVPVTGPRLPLAAIAAALAMSTGPSLINLASSPIRMAQLSAADYVPLVIGSAQHRDLLVSRDAANNARHRVILTEGFRSYYSHEPEPPLEFRGEVMRHCTSAVAASYYASIAADLTERGLAQNSAIFTADLINPLWLYGPYLPVPNGAPWHYSGLPGLSRADFVLVPTCPSTLDVWQTILTELDDQNVPLTEIVRTPVYRLYSR